MTPYKKALEKSLEYFGGDDLAASVFLSKYALTSPQGDLLEQTPTDMHKRLAKEFARIETKYPNPMSEEEIFGLLKDFKYIIPQGSPMSGIGNPYQTMSLSNCFVIESPWDSYSGILKADQEEAQIMKRRGGVGFDISTIRPRGIPTNNAAKTTDGIAVFMERFSNTCREVAQGGRRGALMLTISVHHPEISTFINIKRDLKKVTGANISIRLSDEFMQAVKDGTEVELRWPVDSREPSIRSRVDAKKLWTEIIESAHASAEPGLLFWDTVMRRTPSHCYPDFQSTSTNPCFSGETLIATADGRGAVSIKQLAEEEKDVPVYSVSPSSGGVSVKMGRNPRLTGTGKKLVRVTLDDSSYFDVTPDHKCLLRDGTSIFAKDLKTGMSLPRFTKEIFKPAKHSQDYSRINVNTRAERKYVSEHRLIAEFSNPEKWSSLFQKEKKNGWINGGLVVHHKDYNGLNNSPDNLDIMSFAEHQKFHAAHDNVGENNGRFSGVSNSTVKEHGLALTKQLGRRFSDKEWQKYAAAHQIPVGFSSWRQRDFFASPIELAKACAVEMGFQYPDADPRLLKTLQSMLSQGYSAEIVGTEVQVRKTCETCGAHFAVKHSRREISFCSHACSLVYVNSNREIAKKRTIARNKRATCDSVINQDKQAEIYSELKFRKNGIEPRQKEWEASCKEKGVPFRVGKMLKNGFKTWKEVKEAGNSYNHKVVSVHELPGSHDVYNITVDDNHTLAIITSDSLLNGVFVAQCGELVLNPYDSCRLLLVNVLSFIKDPFTDKASFDFAKYSEVVQKAQRLMDDMIDLELESVDKILAKIRQDPEPEDVKKIELDLWTKIRNACERGRRTGTGVTAIGDALAALNVVYGSSESIEWIETMYRELALNCYRSTVTLAKERGAFPAFNYELEKNHEFLNQIMDLDPELRKNWEAFGRRNIALTTTAPAGSVSILTQTTSGIEPAFLLHYKRRKKVNPEDKTSKVHFTDQLGDKWTEFDVYHKGFKQWMDVTGKTNVEESPYHKATSNDIVWVNKVRGQAAAQRWICHSISNTTNVPKETTVDTIKDIYMTGWESGTKGVTVYRDGCRDGVLVSTTSKKEEKKVSFERHDAPKRPKELTCDVHGVTVGGEKWTVFVGKMEGKPYEVMGGLSKFINIPKRVKEGKIAKHNGPQNPVARYDFHYDFEKGPEDEATIKDITNVFDNATHAAFTRTISLALRHGTPVQYVVEQIQKGSEKEDDLFSFSRAIGRVLKHYIEDGTKVTSDKKCPECGSHDLIYQEGCATCKSCGYSKCK